MPEWLEPAQSSVSRGFDLGHDCARSCGAKCRGCNNSAASFTFHLTTPPYLARSFSLNSFTEVESLAKISGRFAALAGSIGHWTRKKENRSIDEKQTARWGGQVWFLKVPPRPLCNSGATLNISSRLRPCTDARF
jgi:hypothetical protein